jgi:hypothetical protein
MRGAVPVAVALLLCVGVRAQEGAATSVDITAEPHHTLLLENSQARVFHLRLQPGEATLPHRHRNIYAYLSLRPITIANDVRGRPPVVVGLEANEVHTSKGGFTITERNKSSDPATCLLSRR